MTATSPPSRVLIHIGYHKTASTWFQAQVFAREDLGFRPWHAPRDAVHRLFCHPAPFEQLDAGLLADLHRQADAAARDGATLVLSHERLSGYPASGGYDVALICDRLSTALPSAVVFGLFRRQPDMILSAWRQQIVDGGGLSLRGFLEPSEPQIVRTPRFTVATYRYSGLVERYHERFGRERTLFQPYERFASAPAAVLRDLAALADRPALAAAAPTLVAAMARENPSLSPALLGMMRIANLTVVRSQLAPHAIVNLGAQRVRGAFRALNPALAPLLRPIDRALSAGARRRIAKFSAGAYAADNARLEGLVGVSLRPFEYELPSLTDTETFE